MNTCYVAIQRCLSIATLLSLERDARTRADSISRSMHPSTTKYAG